MDAQDEISAGLTVERSLGDAFLVVPGPNQLAAAYAVNIAENIERLEVWDAEDFDQGRRGPALVIEQMKNQVRHEMKGVMEWGLEWEHDDSPSLFIAQERRTVAFAVCIEAVVHIHHQVMINSDNHLIS